ncbi:TetR/AcrR family transcriptional regulator [Dongia deserti]|uniref:TetR/AcrR family transcriptional regulator n=1 Tax=Dongia deserti TaxID=2268030 RepID=UPI000E65CD4D|nr:TetR/AcrR family transcriptional regulator [Dongia deserti]
MGTAAKERSARPRRRDEAKAYFRAKLIDAAIEAIARHGFSGLSVSRLVEYSGLARGMVNLHFHRKDKLLHEVLKHLADAYRTSWQAAIARTEDDPAGRLWALVEHDVGRKTHDDRALIAWLAFRQEAITNPSYRPLCDTREAVFFGTVKSLCAALIKDGGYDIKVDVAALGITFLLEGLWLDWALDPHRYRPAAGRAVCRTHLAAIFPKHFAKRAKSAAP